MQAYFVRWTIQITHNTPDSARLASKLARDQETVLALTEQDWKMMGRISQLAISAEPMGGSPTGNPTGPIMYKGDFVSLI